MENVVSPLALGRKNFLFCGNHDAALRASIVYSQLGSCKAVGVNPREWLEDVLLRILEAEAAPAAIRELLPDCWTKKSS